MSGVYTVSQVNSYIKNMFRQDFVLNRISIKGEVSNCKYHSSGHIYFTLKDENGTLSAIMFSRQAKSLNFKLENGNQVVVTGRIDVYERDGKYQLYASEIQPDGMGDLYRKFEQLKSEYEQMGYFSDIYKKKIPAYATKIGVVTAATGAAIHDIMNISHQRNPYVQLYLYSAQVQGENAKYSIANGIATLDSMNLDVIIVGRGGGSIEDLWAFNEELVVEAIFNANTPVISAVGHETDFTIADFVADMRASTPSHAAQLAVFDISDLDSKINTYSEYLNKCMSVLLEKYRNKTNQYELRVKLQNPVNIVNEKRHRLINIEDKLTEYIKQAVVKKRHMLEVYASRLNGVSPLNKLSQGYSYTEDSDGNNISSITDVSKGDLIKVYIKDGIIKAKAMEVSNGKITNT